MWAGDAKLAAEGEKSSEDGAYALGAFLDFSIIICLTIFCSSMRKARTILGNMTDDQHHDTEHRAWCNITSSTLHP